MYFREDWLLYPRAQGPNFVHLVTPLFKLILVIPFPLVMVDLGMGMLFLVKEM